MVSAATIERDKISARNLCRLVPRDVRPDAIDQPIAVRYRNARLKEGARPRTVLNELSFLRGLLQFALAWETVTGMRGIRFLKVPAVGEWTSDGVALSRAEFARVLPVLSPINRRRMIFGICTMLRRTPLMGLKAPWVHHDRGWLSVPAEVMKKGRASYRSPLEVPVAEWALEQVADLEANEHGYVWPSGQTGQPLTRVHDFFADCVERSGVRHSLATTSVRPARRGSAKLGWMSSSSQCCSAIAPPLIRRQRPFMSRAPT
jgi:integrase